MRQKLDRGQIMLTTGIILMLAAAALFVSGGLLQPGRAAMATNLTGLTSSGRSESGGNSNGIMAGADGNSVNNPNSLSDTGIFGTVGIGTASPQRPLHLAGNIALFERAQDSAGFIIQRTESNRWVLGVNESPSLGNGFVLSTYPVGASSSTPRLLVATNGKVGINTTSPDSQSMLYVTSDIAEGARAVYGLTSANVYMADHQGVYGKHFWSQRYGYLGGRDYGVRGGEFGDMNYGYLGANTQGAFGYSYYGDGVSGLTYSGNAVYGYCQGLSQNYAAHFDGNVRMDSNDVWISGSLHKGNDYFLIDHPKDPENKYLQHSVIESPEMMNVYRGHVLLDDNGESLVEMPAYFEALNRDFEYQLTAIGASAPGLYVTEEISGNHFKIAGGKPGLKVSWQVTGVRQDAFARAHPMVVEMEKPASEKGLYLHPREWGQPEEKGINQLKK